MSILLAAGVIVAPLVLLLVQLVLGRLRYAVDLVAALAAYAFGIISVLAVYDMIRNGTVFMTDVHKVFTNGLFLVSGGYLGAYGIALILGGALKAYRDDD